MAMANGSYCRTRFYHSNGCSVVVSSDIVEVGASGFTSEANLTVGISPKDTPNAQELIKKVETYFSCYTLPRSQLKP